VKAAAYCGFLAMALAPGATAETIFFIDTSGLVHCNSVAGIAEGFAEHKHAGLSKDEMRQVMTSGGVEVEVAELMVQVIYSFDAADTQTYRSIVGALCVLDRLQPLEVEH
jgi:hypothetical protein